MTPSNSFILGRSPQASPAATPSKIRRKTSAPTLPLPISRARVTASAAQAKASGKHVEGKHHRDQRASASSHDSKDDGNKGHEKKSDKHERGLVCESNYL